MTTLQVSSSQSETGLLALARKNRTNQESGWGCRRVLQACGGFGLEVGGLDEAVTEEAGGVIRVGFTKAEVGTSLAAMLVVRRWLQAVDGYGMVWREAWEM
ncbi:hypothetical protein HPP92_015621 [Vanilla planifolia]|uniref:Uncharacterized protein n=1 Tax=Vanilla planifolia TaxID=51239 RepID=A0A835QID8_VANPL|nr:hypothetical protein HPP92_016280 [Vanilla planifolia]KAG0471075.1 hypothetical protein HPP92_015621 [Vanilla planifolia]